MRSYLKAEKQFLNHDLFVIDISILIIMSLLSKPAPNMRLIFVFVAHLVCEAEGVPQAQVLLYVNRVIGRPLLKRRHIRERLS